MAEKHHPEDPFASALSRRQLLRRSGVGLGSVLSGTLFGGAARGRGADQAGGQGKPALDLLS